MAAKKTGESVPNLTVAILRNIRDEIRGMREEMTGMREEMTGMRGEMTGMREDIRSVREEVRELRDDTNARFAILESLTARGFEAVTGRLENLRDLARERWRDHERRIRRLESRVR